MSCGFRIVVTSRISFILFCTIIGVVLSSGFGKCPTYPSQPNFDVKRMTGTWYEVERSFYIMEVAASCTQINVTVSDRGYLYFQISNVNRWTGNPSTALGIGVPSANGSAVFRYKHNSRLPYMIARLLPGAGQYTVLYTDYDQFAVLWSCTALTVAHTDHLWVLGRQRDIPAALRVEIYAMIEHHNLDPDRLLISKNTNCTEPTA